MNTEFQHPNNSKCCSFSLCLVLIAGKVVIGVLSWRSTLVAALFDRRCDLKTSKHLSHKNGMSYATYNWQHRRWSVRASVIYLFVIRFCRRPSSSKTEVGEGNCHVDGERCCNRSVPSCPVLERRLHHVRVYQSSITQHKSSHRHRLALQLPRGGGANASELLKDNPSQARNVEKADWAFNEVLPQQPASCMLLTTGKTFPEN